MLKLQIFEQIYFFHQKCFFSNGECNLDNGSKYFSESPHICSSDSENHEKKLWTFRKENNFPKNVPMYM